MFNRQLLYQMKKAMLLILLLPFSFCHAQVSKPPNKKNIVLLFADDVGIGDIPGYVNNPPVELPNIDSLRLKGITYKNFHATPWCSPSRYALLSGNYQFRGTYPRGPWDPWGKSAFKHGQETIAKLLKKNGYDTAMFGKWHLGGKIEKEQKPQKYSRSNMGYNLTQPLVYGPTDNGFDTSKISLSGIQGPPFLYYRNSNSTVSQDDIVFYDVGEYDRPQGMSEIKNAGRGDKAWDTSNFNIEIVKNNEKFLDEHAKNNPTRPFFSFLSLGAIHVPFTPPNVFIDGTPVKGTYGKSAEYDMLYELDLVVGFVISSLKTRGLLDDTLIIFTSDNGGGRRNGNLKGRKGTIWEGGNTVPFIMSYGDKFQAGGTRNQLAGITDIYATLAEFAEIEVPKDQAKDSRSLLKSVYDQNELIREDFFVFNYITPKLNERYKDRFGSHPIEQSMRTARYKLIYHTKNSFIMMYDLVNDPSETKEICSENFETCNMLFREMIERGPCGQDIKGGWCPGQCEDDPDFRYKGSENGMSCNSIASKKSSKQINKMCGYAAMNPGENPVRNPIRDYCRKTCGVCDGAGTVIPSHNNNSKEWKRFKNQNCDWVALKPEQRCNFFGRDGNKAYTSCKKACWSTHYMGF